MSSDAPVLRRSRRAFAQGDLIFQARHALGLGQRGLGAIIGRSSETVHRWERGQAPPSPSQRVHLVVEVAKLNVEVARTLAAGLEVDPSLVDANAPPAPRPARDAAAVESAVAAAIYAAADLVDVPAKKMRRALGALLDSFARDATTLDEARAALARITAKRAAAAKAATK